MKRKKKSELKKWKDKAWAVFSQYIRLRDADGSGMVKCCTCPTKKHWKEMQAGHFLDGRGNAVLFEERGVHPQCYVCNVLKRGNGVYYMLFMQSRYPQDVIDQMIADHHKIVPMTAGHYEAIHELYQKKVEAMQ